MTKLPNCCRDSESKGCICLNISNLCTFAYSWLTFQTSVTEKKLSKGAAERRMERIGALTLMRILNLNK